MQPADLFVRIAAISGFLAVAFGAFGAHSLERLLSPDMLQTYQTGVTYQFYHSLALLFIALLAHSNTHPNLTRAGFSFLIGIILFSGSLYLLSTREILGLWWKGLGIITPVGGLFFLAGWLFLFFYALKPKS